jgi:sugar O-acyltransferase (sialic acid O-acetyltransferase NeuD family)
MSRESILLVGAGGHARSCIDVIEQEGRYVVGGLVGLPAEVGSHVLNYPVLGSDLDLPDLLPRFGQVLVAVGQIKSPEARIKLHAQLEAQGWHLPVVVSPRAQVSPHARVGAGTIIMHGAIINAGARIGCNCIINSQSLIEHDVVIGDHCHIATAAVINGDVSIGAGTFIGSNACVRQGIRVAERCVVGMGQLVMADFVARNREPHTKGRS